MVSPPDFSFERTCWKQGFSIVIGIDEVGRGALAGPVVAGAAMVRIMNHELRIRDITSLGIDDSKRLTPSQREKLVPLIHTYFHCAVGQVSVAEINKIGIVRATHRAMRRAINSLWSIVFGLQSENTHRIAKDLSQRLIGPWPKRQKTKDNVIVLVDGSFPIPRIGIPQETIVKGDQKSISIAAASIIAKVYRDRYMVELSSSFPVYRWQQNKGYGTTVHCQAIASGGPCDLHRKDFLRSFQSNGSLDSGNRIDASGVGVGVSVGVSRV